MSEEQNNKNIIQMLYYVIKTYDTGLSTEDINSLDNMHQQLQTCKDLIKENTVLVKDDNGDYQECTIDPVKLHLELKKHKDKEDKLREWLDNSNVTPTQLSDILQILDGSDE